MGAHPAFSAILARKAKDKMRLCDPQSFIY